MTICDTCLSPNGCATCLIAKFKPADTTDLEEDSPEKRALIRAINANGLTNPYYRRLDKRIEQLDDQAIAKIRDDLPRLESKNITRKETENE